MFSEKTVALFIFAHQNNKLGIFKKIVDWVKSGRRVCCVYFTVSFFKDGSSKERNKKSLFVLKRLGVCFDDIFFVGDSLSIPDGRLSENMKAAGDWLKNNNSEFPQLASI